MDESPEHVNHNRHAAAHLKSEWLVYCGGMHNWKTVHREMALRVTVHAVGGLSTAFCSAAPFSTAQ